MFRTDCLRVRRARYSVVMVTVEERGIYLFGSPKVSFCYG